MTEGTESFESHMNEADAVLWGIERDPTLRTTIVAIVVLDRSPDWPQLLEKLDRASRAIPRLRQRVVPTPLRLGPPRWVTDDHFDLGFHVRRVLAPPPGDIRSLLDLAAPLAMTAFDRARPLWEFTVVEGLEDDRAALIQKVHHSFTDGVGGVRLALMLVDLDREPTIVDPMPREPTPERVGPLALASESLAANLRAAGRALQVGAQGLPGVIGDALRRPGATLFDGVRTLRSVAKILSPVRQPLSPIMRSRSLSRRLDVLDVPLQDLKDAAHAAGGTLNDAFLGAVTGGLRRYHEAHGVAVDNLRMTMPVNRRTVDDAIGNNRFTAVRFAMPISIDDPGDRIRRLGALARQWRAEPAIPLSDLIAAALNRLPVGLTTSVFGSMLKGIDFAATNVPGIPFRVYMAGAEVLREYALGPPSGAAVNIALMSHGDTCCIGINSDPAAIPDPEMLTACVAEGFDEVLSLVPVAPRAGPEEPREVEQRRSGFSA